MNLQDIITLYAYNDWATQRILAAGAQVTPEQFVTSTDHSYGSLRGTLVHTLDAEYGWRMLCQHNTFTLELEEAEFPTLDALAQRWQTEQRAMQEYITSLQDEDLMQPVRYTTDSGQKRARILWHCLLHVVNHGTQHRSEAAAMLTAYGHSPGDLDFTVFLSHQEASTLSLE